MKMDENLKDLTRIMYPISLASVIMDIILSSQQEVKLPKNIAWLYQKPGEFLAISKSKKFLYIKKD